MFRVNRDRAQERRVAIELDRRGSDNTIARARHKHVLFTIVEAVERQMLALEQRLDDVHVRRLRRGDDDALHA